MGIDGVRKEIDKLYNKIEEFQYYIDLYNSYEVTSFETAAIKYYAELGRVDHAAKKMNELGYRVPGARGPKKLNSNDVTAVLEGKELDEFHRVVKRMFIRSRKITRRFT